LSDLTYTLLSEGSSDRCLQPLLEWLLHENGVRCAINGEWADLGRLTRIPRTLAEKISTAVQLYPCELLFVHRDADTAGPAKRRSEIEAGLTDAHLEGVAPAGICVIPVRAQEAWLLSDESAIRYAAENPSGRVPLALPLLSRCETLPEPKRVLHELLLTASGLPAHRRHKARAGRWAHRVLEFVRDFAPLRVLPAFAALEADIRQAITAHRWDERV
jgi:hypothetical protein